jgi:hypothetical protein
MPRGHRRRLVFSQRRTWGGGETTEVVDVDKGDGNNGAIVLSLDGSAKRACGGWGRALPSLSLYAGEGNSDRPRRDDDVPSTSNSYDTGEGHSDPPRTDDNVAYTFSGQEGGPNIACGGWGRASSSSYAGEGDSDRPRRDDNVASTSNSYGAIEGDSDPPRTDNDVAYTISGQEGGHPGGVVGVDDAGSRSVAGGASSISMHKTCKREGTYGAARAASACTRPANDN